MEDSTDYRSALQKGERKGSAFPQEVMALNRTVQGAISR